MSRPGDFPSTPLEQARADLEYLTEHGALSGAAAVLAERRRQIEKGYTPEHDRDEHRYDGYLTHRAHGLLSQGWYGADAVTEAGALAAAEIDRTGQQS